jgi:tRNA A58 N-methylase Trm61
MELGAGGGSLSIPLLVDTKTGKVWKLNINENRFIGLTVEGLAYSSSDSKDFYNQVQNIEIKDIPSKDIKQFKDNIFAAFSYVMDTEKIDKLYKDYYKKQNE